MKVPTASSASASQPPSAHLQLFDRLLAHVLQLADMVLHAGDVHLASCAGAACGHHKALADCVADAVRAAVQQGTHQQAEGRLAPRQDGLTAVGDMQVGQVDLATLCGKQEEAEAGSVSDTCHFSLAEAKQAE